ncbi:MAG: FAD-dependent oxidoreductase [Bacteriovoracaceae bacterium]|nr:FAD-dependent oxidoreductase [Bacteriovoracaceae bacterium]
MKKILSNEVQEIDFAIVGGGIIGLWISYYLLKKYPSSAVVVFEAGQFLGEHTTTRNSEVLHSGIYYQNQSLKHIHCLEGNQLWREYVHSKNMDFLDCGKIIVATKGQEEKLNKIFENGLANKVQKIEFLSEKKISEYKEILNLDYAIHVGPAGVLNVGEALRHLQFDIEAMGGIILKNTFVKFVEKNDGPFILKANDDNIKTPVLINAAGLFAVEFRKTLGLMDIENFFVKGSYLKLNKKLPLQQLVYPIPPESGLGLGVHLTLDTSGAQKFGPNTEIVNDIIYNINENLIFEMKDAINMIFKNIDVSHLQLAYSGIRPKIKKNGVLVTDFTINGEPVHGIGGYLELLGMESPGLTASPSLAKFVVNKML